MLIPLLMPQRRNALIAIAALVVFPALDASAQSSVANADRNCSYETCALGLAPVWNGLAITKGETERQVGNLGFFWPSAIASVFAGDASASEAANDAVDVRTVAVALTDAGAALIATGVARAIFRRDFDGFSKVLTTGGIVALGASVPVHLAADGLVSRAVWLYNRKFAK